MKELLILRHAKSSWKDEDLPDHDRPLKKRGRRDAPRMGRLLHEQDILPDLILCSTARRARETVEMLAEAGGYAGEIRYKQELYGAAPSDFRRALQAVPDDCPRMMLVGHNPGLERFVEVLAGEYVRLPTAAIARVQLEIEHWADFADKTTAKLLHVWRPKELD